MSEQAWTGSPVRPHAQARDNGAESLPWGGRRERLPLRWPFAAAVQGFRDKALANPEYDPASTFVWGQMMAVGVIAMLQSVESSFGAAGHDVARAALRRVGAQIVEEMVAGVALPEDMAPVEAASLFASWINEVVYASIEKPRVHGETADFDIHYCPHEDVYGAFDCRVQRYLVEGMIEAGRAFFGAGTLDVAFATTIPSGAATCHFDIVPRGDGAGEAWTAYSDELRERALRRLPVVDPPG